MENQRTPVSSESNVETISKINLSDICQVCTDQRTRMNYSVRCCDACKLFFRRNAQLDLSTQRCSFGDECHITVKNRHTCRYCRLKKCFSVGMKKELIRAQYSSQSTKLNNKSIVKYNNSNEKKTFSPIVIYTLDLLRNDRSLLTSDQWSLLSNITNAYNNRSPAEYIRSFISSQSNYPPKIRLKLANANHMEIVGSMYLAIEPFIKIIPEFINMTLNDQTALIERNLRNLGGFNCAFVMRETDIFNDVAYSNAVLATYGSWTYKATAQIGQQSDADGTLIKLLLVILAFSTSCDVVYLEYDQNQSTTVSHILINTKYLFKIQNIYIEMMFKYMLYRYGYDQAALRFACLMKNFLYQSVVTANAVDNSRHESMVQTAFHKAKQSLALEEQLDDTNI